MSTLISLESILNTKGYFIDQQTLEISGKAAYRVSNIMRITGLALDSATNGGIEEYNSNYFNYIMHSN